MEHLKTHQRVVPTVHLHSHYFNLPLYGTSQLIHIWVHHMLCPVAPRQNLKKKKKEWLQRAIIKLEKKNLQVQFFRSLWESTAFHVPLVSQSVGRADHIQPMNSPDNTYTVHKSTIPLSVSVKHWIKLSETNIDSNIAKRKQVLLHHTL